jgi:hypothetical protein
MADDQKFYPKAQLALGNGDLMDVFNVRHEITNNGKQIGTLRKPGAGVFKGNEESMVNFDAYCSEDGYERDYLKMIKKGQIKQLRFKVPGETLTVNGMATKRSTESSTDDAIKYSIEFKGHTEDP